MACVRLDRIRKLMKEKNLQALIVPSQDAHQSEYVSEADKRREYLTGFTGSAGTAVVTHDQALLWTDGRYYQQAEKQKRQGWQVVRGADRGVKPVHEYLASHLNAGDLVGIYGDVLSVKNAELWDKTLRKKQSTLPSIMNRPLFEDYAPDTLNATRTMFQKAGGVMLAPMQTDLVDAIWDVKPSRPCGEVLIQPLERTGKHAREKVAELRQDMKDAGVDAIVLSALDEIAWLLNLRGSDIQYTPVFFGFLALTQTHLILLVGRDGIAENSSVMKYLMQEVGCTKVVDYESRYSVLSRLTSFVSHTCSDAESQESSEPAMKKQRTEAQQEGSEDDSREERHVSVWIDPATTSVATQLACGAENSDVRIKIVARPSPIPVKKAMKNDVELEGMRRAHLLEGASLCRFFAWLDETMKEGKPIDEIKAAEQLERFREEVEEYRGPSFETISAYGENAAIIHYSPTQETSKALGMDSLYLCDTGGQYTMGTTDMTRTLSLSGKPSAFEKFCFTLVLEGHVNLAKAVFMEGTEPAKLDALTRLPLWQHGLDYRHGTSHGLGSFLGVHEYPPLIHSGFPAASSNGAKFSATCMRNGMVLSNEPGYYQPNEFGIRIENVFATRKKEGLQYASKFDANASWLCLEVLTFVPIQTCMIDTSILSAGALEWLNAYHQQCRELLLPLLKDKKAREWLLRETAPLEVARTG